MESISSAPLWGIWKLNSCRLRSVSEEGIESFVLGPFGSNPLGRITMTPEGYFSVLSTSAEGAAKGNISKWTLDRDENIAKAARPMVTYCGPYKTWQEGDESILSIEVEVALDPNIIGGAMVRAWSIREEDNRVLLTLKGRDEYTMTDGMKGRLVLIWEKVSGP